MSDLPHDAKLEFSVLGLALLDEDAHATIATLPASIWHDANNASIAVALHALHAAGKKADVAAVEGALRERGTYQTVGGHGALVDLLSTATFAPRLEQHIATLREFAHVRKVIAAAERTIAAATKLRGPDLSDFVARAFDDAVDVNGDAEPVELEAALQQAFTRIEQLAAGALSGGYEWGFPSLDRQVLPMRGGQLIVVAARPACGKTSIALNCLLHIARAGGRVYFASLETQTVDVALRVLASVGKVNLAALGRGRLTDRDWQDVLQGAQTVSRLPVLVDDDYGLTLDVIARKAARLKKRGGLHAIFVDYLQLIEAKGSRDNREREIAAVARGLKKLAKQLDVPVIALAQLNRESVKGGNERKPVVSDLRESGAIEQDADVIMLMHRVGVGPGRVAVEIAKQKNGPTGTTWLAFDGATVTFSDDGADNGMPPEQGNPAAASGVHRKQTGYQQRTAGAAVVQPDDDEFPPYVHGSEGFDAAK